MANDNDIKTDFDTAYDQASKHWSSYLAEAKKDVKFGLGDQWDADDASYLKGQGREALVFDKTKRILRLISGYERKNRLSLKIEPIEGADETSANQFSGLVLWIMNNSNGYFVLSDAFEKGTLKAGINLVEVYMSYKQDMLNGDILFKRRPYNKFLLDPNMTERDLSDCGYILTRDYLSRESVRCLLPSNAEAIKDMKPKGIDNKYSQFLPAKDLQGNDLFAYDQFWIKTQDPYTILIDPQTGEQRGWTGSKQRLDEAQKHLVAMGMPELKVIKGYRDTIKLSILVDGEVFYKNGPDPLGIGEYPYIAMMGFFEPEYDEAQWKLQGLIRCLRDPGTEANKRRSKMLDIIDSQISSGWKAKSGSVVNPEDMYQSGQGKVIWINEQEKYTLSDVEKIQSSDIPPGLFQLTEILDRDMVEIPGANQELFGAPDNDDIQVAGILAKLRTAQGLIGLQDIFDGLRLCKKLLGKKIVKTIQNNWRVEKVRRIINENPSREFYDRKFGKYDCTPVEGLLTDSQRQMHFTQIMALKQLGAPIPWAHVIDASPIENKNDLKKAIEEQEKMMSKQSQVQMMLQNLQTALMQSKLKTDISKSIKDQTQAEENRTQAMLDRAKMMKEIEGMDFDKMMQLLNFMKELSEPGLLENTSTTGNT